MINIEVLSQVYTTMTEYVNPRERQAIADHVFSIVNDSDISEKDLMEFASSDVYLKRALDEYMGDEDDDDYDSEFED